MSFVTGFNLPEDLTKTHLRKDHLPTRYLEIGKKFYEHYLHLINNNFVGIVYLFRSDCRITYLNKEYAGYDKYLADLRRDNINKLTYYKVEVTVQPVENTGLLITAVGTASINDSIYTNKFSETILVKLYDYSNLYISNYVFKLLG